jgi:hypothetical protein
MNPQPDPRIPILFGGHPGPTDALLVESGQPAPKSAYAVTFTLTPTHPSGCTCCTPRGPAADALAALFQARARATAPYFTRIIALTSPAGESALRDALSHDLVTRSRYRLGVSASC